MKKTTPLLLMLIMVSMLLVSWSNTLKYPGLEEKEYNKCFNAAKEYEEKGIYIDAASQYEKALALRPKNYEIAQRLMELYSEENLDINSKYVAACKKANQAKPDMEEPYDRLLTYYQNSAMSKAEYDLLLMAVENTGRQKYVDRLIELRGEFTQGVLKENYLTRFHKIDGTGYAIAEKEGNKYLVDDEGNTILFGEYEHLGFLSENVIPVCKEGDWYFASKEGYKKLVPDHKATYLGNFGSGFAPACIDGKYGFLNKRMKEFRFEYDFAGCFDNGVAAVQKNGVWQVINTSFKPVIDVKFEDVLVDSEGYCSSFGVFIAKKSGKYYVYSTAGKCLSDGFDDAKLFVSSQPAAVKNGSKWGFVSKDGKTVCEPRFENVDSFCAGYAPFCKDGKWGVLDCDFHEIVEAQYDSMKPFEKDATAPVTKDSVEMIIRMKIKS